MGVEGRRVSPFPLKMRSAKNPGYPELFRIRAESAGPSAVPRGLHLFFESPGAVWGGKPKSPGHRASPHGEKKGPIRIPLGDVPFEGVDNEHVFAKPRKVGHDETPELHAEIGVAAHIAGR